MQTAPEPLHRQKSDGRSDRLDFTTRVHSRHDTPVTRANGRATLVAQEDRSARHPTKRSDGCHLRLEAKAAEAAEVGGLLETINERPAAADQAVRKLTIEQAVVTIVELRLEGSLLAQQAERGHEQDDEDTHRRLPMLE
jgi:hypothetical protein